MQEVTKEYTNGEVTIVWQPHVCIHSRICWSVATGLPEVFQPAQRPWIKPEGASTEHIVEQVKKCPSGALSYYMNAEKEQAASVQAERLVEISPNGPLLVYGNIVLKDAQGNETEHTGRVTAFCRCGQSANKPYCDGSHLRVGFTG